MKEKRKKEIGYLNNKLYCLASAYVNRAPNIYVEMKTGEMQKRTNRTQY